MKSSSFMDKKITSKSRSFFDDDDDDDDPFDAEPSFSFPPIPPKHTTLHQVPSDRGGAGALISEIDRKIKEHTEKVVHAVGGLIARVSQLENRTLQLESTVGDLKNSVEFNHGRITGKIRELGNIVEEVQCGIRDLRDKHEIAEAQVQLAKLTMSKVDQSTSKAKVEQSSAIQIGSVQALQSSVPQLPQIQASVPVACPQQLSSFPSGAVQNPPHPNIPSSHAEATAPQLPTQCHPRAFPCVPHSESTYPPSMLTLDTSYQQYPLPSNQQMQQPSPPPPQPCRSTPQLSPIPQLPHPQQQHPSISIVNSNATPLGYESKNVPYLPSQSIHNSPLPSIRSPTVNEIFVGSKQQNQGQFFNNPYTELPSGYSHAQGHSSSQNRYPYGASSSSYNVSATKPSQLSPSSPVVEAGRSHSRLPTAKILPHALPTASTVDGGSDSSQSGNRIPVDDVIDKVVAMGFRRDLARATVRKLTANGQSVDLNVVLDKLMNGQDI